MKDLKKIINKLDWKLIQEVYTKNNIIWDTFDNEDDRVPKASEIKEELYNIILFMVENSTPYMMFDIFLIIFQIYYIFLYSWVYYLQL